MRLEEFLGIHRQLAQAKRARFRLIFWCLIATLVICLLIAFQYQSEATRSTSRVAARLGFEELAKDLEWESRIREMEKEAKTSFGTEVVRVELPRSRWHDFSMFTADYLPDGRPLSFITTPEDRFLSFIPASSEEFFWETFDSVEADSSSRH